MPPHMQQLRNCCCHLPQNWFSPSEEEGETRFQRLCETVNASRYCIRQTCVAVEDGYFIEGSTPIRMGCLLFSPPLTPPKSLIYVLKPTNNYIYMNTQIILKATDLVIKAGIFTTLFMGLRHVKSVFPNKTKSSTQNKHDEADDNLPSEDI